MLATEQVIRDNRLTKQFAASSRYFVAIPRVGKPPRVKIKTEINQDTVPYSPLACMRYAWSP